MYQAINDYVIAKRVIQEKTTNSGIILTSSSETDQVFELEVVATTDLTRDLKDKIIIAPRHKCTQITESEKEIYGAVKLEDIIGIKDE